MTSRLAPLALCLALSGCLRDTSLPAPSARGSVQGALAFSDPTSPGGHLVTLLDVQGGAREATSADDGSFRFTDLSPGAYSLAFEESGYFPEVVPAVKVRAGETTTLKTLRPTLKPGTRVLGLVQAPGGGSVLGAAVTFLLGPTRTEVRTTLVGADGRFSTEVPPGHYALRATHPDFVTGELSGVEVAEGSTTDLSATPVQLALNPSSLDGTVTREREALADAPAEGAQVTLDSGETTTVDAAGHFHFSGLAAGTRRARVTLAAHDDPQAGRAVTLTPGATATLEPVRLVLVRGSISGVVELADQGASTDGVTVALTGSAHLTGAAPLPNEPWRGRFTLDRVPLGTWELAVTREKYSRAVRVLTLGAAALDAGTITLARMQGDFAIDDGDPDNTEGFARTPAVTLRFHGFPSTGVARFRASESAAFAGVAFAPYTGPAQAFSLSPGDGEKTVYAQYEDAAGTTSATFSSRVTVDSQPPAAPAVRLVSTGSAGTLRFTSVGTALTVEVAGSDPGSGLAGMRVSHTTGADGGVAWPSTAQPVAVLTSLLRSPSADGPETVWVELLDHAGNHSAPGQDTVVVDTQAPSGTLHITAGPKATAAHLTNQVLVDLDLATQPEPHGGALQVRVSNARGLDLDQAVLQAARGHTPWFLDSTGGEGLRTVYAVLRDAAGNTSTELSDTITWDITPPANVTLAVQGGPLVRSADVVLVAGTSSTDLSPTEALTVSQDPYFTSGGTVGPQTFDGGALGFHVAGSDGAHPLYARLRDAAGNDAFASVLATLDTEAPRGTLALLGTLADGARSSALTALPKVDVQFQHEGALAYRWVTAGTAQCPDPRAVTYTALPTGGVVADYGLATGAGDREVRACLADAAGNASLPLSAHITLDGDGPASCVLALEGNRVDGTTAGADQTALATVTATVSGCGEAPTELALGAGTVTCSATAVLDWRPFTASRPFALAGPDGAQVVSGCVRDAARNVGALAPRTITLDTTPPTGVSLVVNGGAGVVAADGGSTLSATVAGQATGAARWALSEDPASFPAPQAFAGPVTHTFAVEGTTVLYARFEDEVGNVAPLARASVLVDVTPPDVNDASVAVKPTAGEQAGFVRRTGVVLAVSAPTDALTLQVVEGAPGCAAPPWSTVPTQPVAPEVPFTLSGTEAGKTLCARFFDQAGNASDPVSTSVTLDVTPPTQPRVVTQAQVLAATNNTAFTVTTTGAVTETNFARYELLGGALKSWTAGATSVGTTSFTFNLVSDGSAQTGVPNTLRLRAVDRAGNVSGEDFVVITTDIVQPLPPQLDPTWVDNGNGKATVYWKPSPVAAYNAASGREVKGYRIYYAGAKGQANKAAYTGTWAAEGPSPIFVPWSGPGQQSFTLSSLTNQSPVYVTISAVDQAGNESGAQLWPTTYEVELDPAELSLNPLGVLTVAGLGITDRVVIAGGYAYVASRSSTSSSCPTSGGTSALTVLDLGALSTAVQGGTLKSARLPQVVTGPLTFNDALGCTSSTSLPPHADVVVEPPWLYFVSGKSVRIFSMTLPGTAAAPALVTTIDLSALPNLAAADANLAYAQVVGDRLLLSGSTALVSVDLRKLYDANAGTLPDASDADVPMPLAGSLPGPLAVSRQRLFRVATGSPYSVEVLALDRALDAAAAPAWDTSQRIGARNDVTDAASLLASGNLLYTVATNAAGFSVFDVGATWALPAGAGWSGPLRVGWLPGVRTGQMAAGQFAMTGSLALVGDQGAQPGAVRSIDLSSFAAPRTVGLTALASTPAAVATWGAYALVMLPNQVSTWEVAAPRTFAPLGQVLKVGMPAEVSGGFLYTTTHALDLQGGALAAPTLAGTSPTDLCVFDSVRFGERVVSAVGEGLQVRDFSPVTARTPAGYGPANVTTFPTAAGVRITGLAAVGNWLLAAEVRSDGVYVEAFDARPWRNPWSGTAFSLASGSGAYKVLPLGPFAAGEHYQASLSYAQGRAFIGLERNVGIFPATTYPTTPPSFPSGVSTTLLVVDVRSLLDDVAGASPQVLEALGPSRVQNFDSLGLYGSVVMDGVRQTVLRGTDLYVASSGGLFVIDVAAALDEDPATTLPTWPLNGLATPSFGPVDTLAVSGGFVVAAGIGTGLAALASVDVSNPRAPRTVTSMPLNATRTMCQANLESASAGLTQQRMRVEVAGHRAWLSSYDALQVFGLE